jgi:hypothetical protein
MKNILLILCIVLAVAYACDKGSGDPGSNSNMEGGGSTGTGGSLARFTIAGNHLFTVDNQKLKSFGLENETQPVYLSETNAGFNIETIFARGNTLFLGSQSGMYIYDISNPSDPNQLCYYQHIYSCDPVVADSNYAYVTLSTTSRCGRNVNELQIIDIKDLSKPYFLKSYPMTQPQGLGIDNRELFVCDDGLKIYDASDVKNLRLKYKFSIPAIDVIPMNNLLMVLADNGLYQYHYENGQVTLLSKLLTNNQ